MKMTVKKHYKVWDLPGESGIFGHWKLYWDGTAYHLDCKPKWTGSRKVINGRCRLCKEEPPIHILFEIKKRKMFRKQKAKEKGYFIN